jgi:hypothetical protein
VEARIESYGKQHYFPIQPLYIPIWIKPFDYSCVDVVTLPHHQIIAL